MINQTCDMLNDGGWLHISAEGSMWEFYAPIRPFKDGPAYFAYRANKPILPFAWTYREPKGINKLFHHFPMLTLNIGNLVYPDITNPKQQEITDLTIKIHKQVCELAGYKKGENPYEPIYNNSTRIDYYTKEYGIGYKGSW